MLAPADGKLEKIFETNHAFSIVTPSGLEIFVHFGMDTVKLEGKGFERLVNEGDVVKTVSSFNCAEGTMNNITDSSFSIRVKQRLMIMK